MKTFIKIVLFLGVASSGLSTRNACANGDAYDTSNYDYGASEASAVARASEEPETLLQMARMDIKDLQKGNDTYESAAQKLDDAQKWMGTELNEAKKRATNQYNQRVYKDLQSENRGFQKQLASARATLIFAESVFLINKINSSNAGELAAKYFHGSEKEVRSEFDMAEAFAKKIQNEGPKAYSRLEKATGIQDPLQAIRNFDRQIQAMGTSIPGNATNAN